jgi:hypothetical protein
MDDIWHQTLYAAQCGAQAPVTVFPLGELQDGSAAAKYAIAS